MDSHSNVEHSIIEWQHTARSSRVVRAISHLIIAAFGGLFLFVIAGSLLLVPQIIFSLDLEVILLIVLLLLVGGPFSLLYLWPMLTDPDQRPAITAFSWDEASIPWTKRSFTIAAVTGGLFFGGLAVMGVSFDMLYLIGVFALFSPILANLFASDGSIDYSRLQHNGRNVRLRQVTDIHSIDIGKVTVVWISYAKGTGLLAPRLLTIPDPQSTEVLDQLEHGIRLDAEMPQTDPIVRGVVSLAGLLFISVAMIMGFSIDDTALVMYFGGILGGIGLLLLLVVWRGV